MYSPRRFDVIKAQICAQALERAISDTSDEMIGWQNFFAEQINAYGDLEQDLLSETQGSSQQSPTNALPEPNAKKLQDVQTKRTIAIQAREQFMLLIQAAMCEARDAVAQYCETEYPNEAGQHIASQIREVRQAKHYT